MLGAPYGGREEELSGLKEVGLAYKRGRIETVLKGGSKPLCGGGREVYTAIWIADWLLSEQQTR